MDTQALAIRIIITGGTFDKDYDELSGELTFRDTHLPQILETVRLTVPVELEINQLTDSRDMDDDQRHRVVEACACAPERRVIVTHGTDTMTLTAQLLLDARLDKTVVLTGAMVPYSVLGSDAVFNLGCAMTAVQLAPPGVYVVMNGEVFPAGSVRKDGTRGVFVREPAG
jgi:L-asparaginase